MDWRPWRAHFTRQQSRPLPDLAHVGEVAPALRRPLAASLGRFQAGETGEGRIGQEISRFLHPAIDEDYRFALRAFVREEGRHAAILGRAVAGLGGAPPPSPWTAGAFRRVRGLAGVRFKLLVLLVAEVVAVGLYRAVGEGLPSGPLRRALEEIVQDERAHLAFHLDFFAAVLTPPGRLGAASSLVVLAAAAVGVALFDHRATLRALGVSWPTLAGELAALTVGTAWALAGLPRRRPAAGVEEVWAQVASSELR